MVPVIAIVGRPNVGKSTLFNCLTKSRNALVADIPGLTRDRIYGEGQLGDRSYIVVDTAGLGFEEKKVDTLVSKQTLQAIHDASHVIFMLDARAGLTASDQEIAQILREAAKPVTVAVNKVDGLEVNVALSDFYSLGLGEPLPLSAAHKSGVSSLIEYILEKIPQSEESLEQTVDENSPIKIAVIGRPNVGKSTLINRMLGEERVVVFNEPGTTRDSIYIPYDRFGKPYVLIDTAGVRRKGQVRETAEKFSVIKTLQAIETCNVAVLVVDGSEGITEQDLHLLGFILEAGKALVIAINKWDGLPIDQREYIKKEISRRFVFVDYAQVKFISALHGTGVGELYPPIERAYASAMQQFSTSELTRLLEKAVTQHQPPLVHGRRIKLRFAHSGGHNPPVIVIHGKQTDALPNAYRRYLESFYRKALKLEGTPIHLQFRSSANPYVED